MTTKSYEVVLYRDAESGRWVTFVPTLGGITGGGATRDEALATTREQIESHLERHLQRGRAIPDAESVDVVKLPVTQPEIPLEVDEDGLTPQQAEALRRLQAHFAHIPADVDLAAEIIAERREEHRREEEELERARQSDAR